MFKLKKEELKQIESDIEKINTRMHEMLKTNPHVFTQLSDEVKEQRLVLAEKLQDLEVLESDTHEEINQLAIKISGKKKSKEDLK